MDLSALGHQPMHSDNGRVSVVFNGEIYNFQDIREELSDYMFRSNCDTEVIIAAYLKWGIDCVERFVGMYAIALLTGKAGMCIWCGTALEKNRCITGWTGKIWFLHRS